MRKKSFRAWAVARWALTGFLILFTVPVLAQTNYLSNGGFESDKTGWAQWELEPNVVISIVNNPASAKEGSKFAQVDFSGSATYVTFNNDINLAASGLSSLANSAPLKFSAWYRANVAGSESGRLATVYDPDGAAHGWSDNGGLAGNQATWVEQSHGLALDSAASVLRVLLNVNESTLAGQPGTVYWDDAKLQIDTSYNYIPNGSFEDDKTSWGQWEPEPIVFITVINEPANAHQGSKFIQMDFAGNALFVTYNNAISIENSGLLALGNGAPLKFSAWYRADVNGPDAVRLATHFRNSDGSEYGWTDNGGIAGDQATWAQQTHTLSLDTSPETLVVLLNVNPSTISGNGTVWWDDARLELNTDKTYITNGGFELGKMGWAQWEPEPKVVVTILDDAAGAKEGSKYAQVHFKGDTTFATWNQDINMAAAGLISLATGTPLYLSAWYRSDVLGDEVGRLYHFYDVNSNPRGFGNEGFAGDRASWSLQVLPFTMDSTASDLRVLLNVDETTITGDGTVWWDDVRLSLTPPEEEPVSTNRNWTLY